MPHTQKHVMDPTTISLLPADCLLRIFSALPLRDVINCRRVCKTWHKLIKTKQLWKNVTLGGLRIADWKEATQNFKKWKTKGINFSDPNMERSAITQTSELCNLLEKLRGQLQHLRFGILTTSVLDFILNKQFVDLESLSVEFLTTDASSQEGDFVEIEYFDVGRLGKLQQLRELRIILDVECVSYSSFSFSGGLNAIGNLKHLKILCLTSLQSNNSYEFGFLSNLTQLVQLELGDATSLTPEAYKSLSELHHLRQLSLFNGDCTCYSTPCQCQWVDAIGKLTNLVQLELEFVHTIPRLNKSLLKMKQLRSLKIVPNEADIYPNLTAFTVKVAKETTILEVLDGLTWLKSLTLGVYIPVEAVGFQDNDNKMIRDGTGTLIAVKERIQQILPNTVILILPVLKTGEQGEYE